MASAHSFGEHLSEVQLKLEAQTMPELFEEGARALAELSAEVADDALLAPEERIELHERDAAALLVAWLNELVFRSETRKLVYDDVRVERIDDTSLGAVVRGHAPLRARTAVKAATMHDVHVGPSNKGVAATVVLDV